VPTTEVGAATVTLFPEVVVTTRLAPPLILYVKVYGAEAEAPVKVIRGAVAFWQTLVVPETVAVGKGFTVMVALPDWGCEQLVELASRTLKRLYVKVPATLVGTAMVTEFPLVVVMNWLAPPLML